MTCPLSCNSGITFSLLGPWSLQLPSHALFCCTILWHCLGETEDSGNNHSPDDYHSHLVIQHILGTVIGEGNDTPLQYSCLENSMDRRVWWAAVHGVTKSRTRLSNFTLTFHFHALEKEMATHSSVLAWRIPGTGEPGGLPSVGSHRVRHDWSDLAAAAALTWLTTLF